jgi:glutamine amidotransferase
MCRLFAFRSNVPSKAHASLTIADNALSHQAQYHCDGWGIGYYHLNEPYLFRAARGAAEDRDFFTLSERLQSNTLLVHIRRATVGKVDTLNSHPFRFASWIFAHNGTIFEFDKIREKIDADILPEFKSVIFGQTDSERYFFFLLSDMVRAGISRDGRGWIDIATACEAQRKSLSKIFNWSKELGVDPPKANYILTNGHEMFARRAGLELYFSTQKRLCEDALTCEEPNKICLAGILPQMTVENGKMRKCNHLLIASEPIGDENIWEEIPDGTLLALDRNWQIKMCSKPNPFWVTWPPEVTKHPDRKNVIPNPGVF